MKKPSYNFLPDFVYGGIDGTVTTFAVVMGSVGADLSVSVLLILGFANLLADGFSMAVGKYSSDKAELDRIQRIRKDEEDSILNNPLEEKGEIREILSKWGFKGEDLKRATKVITGNKKIWVNMMLNHEFNVIEENINPREGALVTFASFVGMGLIPLLAYLFISIPLIDSSRIMNLSSVATGPVFFITCFFTIISLFLVGTVKSRFSKKGWLISGLETAFLGGMAAVLAYVVGALLSNILS